MMERQGSRSEGCVTKWKHGESAHLGEQVSIGGRCGATVAAGTG